MLFDVVTKKYKITTKQNSVKKSKRKIPYQMPNQKL